MEEKEDGEVVLERGGAYVRGSGCTRDVRGDKVRCTRDVRGDKGRCTRDVGGDKVQKSCERAWVAGRVEVSWPSRLIVLMVKHRAVTGKRR